MLRHAYTILYIYANSEMLTLTTYGGMVVAGISLITWRRV